MEFGAAWALAVVVAGAGAGTCTVQSPAHRVALVELYTSEGCSSCPPADKYLGELQAGDKLVPLALHVDYWNYLGWKDPYGRAAFTERQRWLSDLARSRTIYTPELFVGGRELRSWPGGVATAVERVNAQPAGAEINISVGTPQAGALPLEVRASAQRGGKLHVAVTEDGLRNQVAAGENRGRMLRHEHVVREWLAPVSVAAGGTGGLARSVPLPAGVNADRLAVVAFVQTDEGEVLQAASLKVCKR
ncbi:MAG TPA: DUF1223 domain-containing protein [Pseudoduganella sp.]